MLKNCNLSENKLINIYLLGNVIFYEQELTDDLLSIIHYYSMKSYSNRRKLNNAAKALKTDDNTEN